jgi:hypothetical protein
MGHRFISQALGLTSAITLLLASAGCSKPPSEQDAGGEQVTSAATQPPPATQNPSNPKVIIGDQGSRSASTQDPVNAVPPIRVLPPTLDWGTVAPSAIKSGSVQLQNISSEPLKIIAVQPSCKCTTTSDLDGMVIPPGGSIELEADLEAQPNPGPRTTQIRVLFEGYSNVLTITAKADVSRPIRARPPYINAVNGQNPTGSLLVSSIDRSPFKIVGVQGNPPRYSGGNEPDQDRNSYILDYDIVDYLQPDGRYPRFVVIETDRADAPLLEVMLRHENSMPSLSPIFKLRIYQMNLGRVAPGGSVKFELGVRESTTTGPLVAALVDEPNIRTEILEQSIDDETDDLNAEILFTVDPDMPEGFYYFPVRLYASNQADLVVPAYLSVRSDPGRIPDSSDVSRGEASSLSPLNP